MLFTLCPNLEVATLQLQPKLATKLELLGYKPVHGRPCGCFSIGVPLILSLCQIIIKLVDFQLRPFILQHVVICMDAVGIINQHLRLSSVQSHHATAPPPVAELPCSRWIPAQAWQTKIWKSRPWRYARFNWWHFEGGQVSVVGGSGWQG